VGKWHVHGGDRDRPIPAGPERRGFDVFLSNNCTLDFRAGHCFYFNEAGERVVFDGWEPYGQARQALDFLDTCDPGTPFALFLSVHPPHDHAQGYEAPADLMALYDRDRIALRPGVEPTPERLRDYHGHMAMCTGVDRALGMVLDRLEERGLAENSIVVFTSDHGDLLGSHDRPWPKGFPEDLSLRVPFVMRWPGRVRPGTETDLLLGSLDLMPTLLG
jgi:arylsulfatase A-like enzyme